MFRDKQNMSMNGWCTALLTGAVLHRAIWTGHRRERTL